MAGTITLDDILNDWDADKVMGISRTLMSLHKTHNNTVDQVKNALSVINADWSGKAADESLRAILQTLDDLTDHSEKIKALAKDFSIASEEVNILRRQVKTLQESIAHVPHVTLQLTENKVVTDSHDTETLNKVRNFTKTIAQILAAAHKVDTDLANAIKYVEGIIPSDPITDGPFTDEIANDGTHMDCEYDLLPNGKRVQLPKGAWLESNPHSDGSIITIVHHPDGSIDELIKPPTHISDVNEWMSEHYDPANHIYPDPTTFGLNQGFQKAGCFAELIGTPYRWNGGHDAYGPTLSNYPGNKDADGRYPDQPGLDCSGLQAYLNYLTMDNPPPSWLTTERMEFEQRHGRYFDKIDPNENEL